MLWLLLLPCCLALFSPSRHTVQLDGSVETGYYSATFLVGWPPQPVSLLVDTGSHITAFPCTGCRSCGKHQFQPFNASRSESAVAMKCHDMADRFKCNNCQNDQCGFYISYTEGSMLSGTYYSDQVLFSDVLTSTVLQQPPLDNFNLNISRAEPFFKQNRVQMLFGCTAQETNLFVDQFANGILGLGSHSNSFSAQPNIVDSDFKDQVHGGEQNAFSLCFDTQGGYLTIGGNNPAHHLSQSIAIPFSTANQQYTLSLHSIKIDVPSGPAPTLGFSNTILDTGTTLTYMPQSLFNDLMAKITQVCEGRCKGYQRKFIPCFFVDRSDFAALIASIPSLILEFDQGTQFKWHARHLFYYDPNDKSYCMAIRPYPGSRTTLGAALMRGHEFHFDKDNYTVYATPAQCNNRNATALLSSFYHELMQPALQKEIFQRTNKEFNDTGLQNYFQDMDMIMQDIIEIKTQQPLSPVSSKNLTQLVGSSDTTDYKVHAYVLVGLLLLIVLLCFCYCKYRRMSILLTAYQLQDLVDQELKINDEERGLNKNNLDSHLS